MTASTQLTFIEKTAEAIAGKSPQPYLPCGGMTKPALSTCESDVVRVDLRPHAGILSYDPSEFLITAKSGTRVAELTAALQAHGQYLPFDPLFEQAGSTIGGAVAAGLSGPNRLLFGGLRDFVMEVEIIDGLGKFVRGGGKVVKNSAGFDLPKLVVGSYGRLGIITELTLKVFPQPAAYATLSFCPSSLSTCIELSQTLLSKAFPITAADICSDRVQGSNQRQLHVRFAGPAASLPKVLERAAAMTSIACQRCDGDADQQLWAQQTQLIEAPLTEQECVVRVAIAPPHIADLDLQLCKLAGQTTWLYSCGGAVAWLRISTADEQQLDAALSNLGLSAIVICSGGQGSGSNNLRCLGARQWQATANLLQRAIDPHGRFLSY